MKTIKSQEEIAFNAISFKDALILLPLMNELVKMVNSNRVADFYDNLPKEEKDKYHRMWQQGGVNVPAESMEGILKVLLDLGFESQIDLKDASINDLKARH